MSIAHHGTLKGVDKTAITRTELRSETEKELGIGKTDLGMVYDHSWK